MKKPKREVVLVEGHNYKYFIDAKTGVRYGNIHALNKQELKDYIKTFNLKVVKPLKKRK